MKTINIETRDGRTHTGVAHAELHHTNDYGWQADLYDARLELISFNAPLTDNLASSIYSGAAGVVWGGSLEAHQAAVPPLVGPVFANLLDESISLLCELADRPSELSELETRIRSLCARYTAGQVKLRSLP